MTDLNDPQNQAVEHPGGPLLIFAGAGSGKTRVLTHRIARLVERGVEPADILAVTFTNKAAGEMEERLEKLIGKEAVDVLWLGTFHATGARILRALYAFTSRRADFSIYDEHDQLTVIKQAVDELHLDKKTFNAVELRDRITKAKEDALLPEDLPAGTELEIGFVRVWERYEKWLEAANAFDFEDLLLVPMRLAESDTEAGHKLRNRFEHVLVDEFQDTSRTQWRFVSALAKKTGNITVVGDDDQCIYEWRNADVKIIRGFPEAFPNATVVKLEQNYRSTGHIVRAALDVIRTSRNRTDKDLWTAADKGRGVLIEACDTDRDEGRFVAREIQSARALGQGAAVLAGKLAEPAEPVGTIAILYRTHAVARAIEEPLRDAEIPYVILGGPRFYDRKEVRDVLAYLRLVQNPSSNVDLLRAINVPARGIGAAKVARLEEIARARGQSLWSATAELQGTGELRPREAEGLRAFRELVYQAQSARKTGIGPKRIAEMLIDESGYQKMWQDAAREFAQLGQHDKAEDAMARAENVSEILSAVGAFEDSQKEAGRKATLDGYLERVALMTSADKKTEGAVAMMTIHAAKGLEFDKVFVVGCEEGLLPLRPEEGDRALDEERRLMYVACTRARKELTLSWSKVRYVHGKLVPNAPSRFLRAIDPDEYGDS